MKYLSNDDRAEWRNIWCILRSLDYHELRRAGSEWGLSEGWDPLNVGWPKFRDDPHGYLLQTDVAQAAIIWSAVEKRLK